MGQATSAFTEGENGSFAINPERRVVDDNSDAASFVDPNGEKMLNDDGNCYLSESDSNDEDCGENYSGSSSVEMPSTESKNTPSASAHSPNRSNVMQIPYREDGNARKYNAECSSNMTTGDSYAISNKSPTIKTVTGTEPRSESTTDPATTLPSLLKLSNSEIKSRLKQIDFTIETIKKTSQSIFLPDDIFSWYHDPATFDIDKKNGSIAVNDATLIQKNHMQVAMFILKVSPMIRRTRFKMVPAKISESKFWNAIFYLIQSKGALPSKPMCNGIGNECFMNGVDFSALLQQKNMEIARLEQQISQFQQSLEYVQSNSTNENNECKKCPEHKGKWLMDKESIEFLSLDEEIKGKLRDAKRKRLAEVHEQMKFILDTDNIWDSHGKWSCCGKTKYKSDLCSES